MYESLDIGCGRIKRAEVGLDYGRSAYGHETFLDVQADACLIPFKDKVFNRVVAWCVFEHLLNPFDFLKECNRVLKAGGSVVIVTDNPTHYAWTVLRPGMGGSNHTEYASDHHGIYYPENIKRMFAKLDIKFKNLKWQVKRNYLITYPFAAFFVKTGFWRKECLYWRYLIEGVKQ